MPIEKAGYRRLYDSIGCSIADEKELYEEIPCYGDMMVSVYLGARPKYGIYVTNSDKYIEPNKENILCETTYYRDATSSDYPRKFFTEIASIKWVKPNKRHKSPIDLLQSL